MRETLGVQLVKRRHQATGIRGIKDKPSTNAEWALKPPAIEGVQFREVKNVITPTSVVKEGYRTDWGFPTREIRHLMSVTARPNAILAWHRHAIQTDHVFVVHGTFRAALYDGREDSPSFQTVETFMLSHLRPGLLLIPPGVWHGFQNLDGWEGIYINFFDREYQYDDPDEYKLPYDTDKIPFRF